jgi:hypothetical protein
LPFISSAIGWLPTPEQSLALTVKQALHGLLGVS